MKREVLFRGWSPIDGKWIYGSGVHSTPFRTYLLTDAGRLLEVEPETVGEWTGLVDKAFRKIYEGDVIEVVTEFSENGNPDYVGVVQFYKERACFVAWDEDGNGLKWAHFEGLGRILGNIFDDEDLKKKYWDIYQK